MNYKIRLIKTVGPFEIYEVNGNIIRKYFPNFTNFGQHYSFSFIPKNEIWIGNDVKNEERVFIILHELIERKLMKMGMKYDDAHNKATIFEQAARFKNKLNSANLIKKLLK